MSFFKELKKITAVVAPIAGTVAGAAIGGPAGASMGGSMGSMIGGMLGGGGSASPTPAPTPVSTPAPFSTPPFLRSGSGGVTVGRDGTVNFPGSAPLPPFVNPTLDFINREKMDNRGNTYNNSSSNVTPLLLGVGALLLLNN